MKGVVIDKRFKKLLTIHLVLQVLLIALFVYMAIHFQMAFAQKGTATIFMKSLIVTFVVQLGLLYPIYKFAAFEARREIESTRTSDPAELKQLRQRRILGDVVKTSIFFFYGVFIYLAPAATFVMSTAFFSFMVTVIAYFQCFNFAAKKILAEG